MTAPLQLTDHERAALNGELGETRRKLMETMVLYAEALDADRLVEIEGPGHLVIQDSRSGWGARFDFLEEIVAAGLKTTYPFTIDPQGPWIDGLEGLTAAQREVMSGRFASEERYAELMLRLGLRDRGATTCTPWFHQVGNRPEFGQIVAWAESSAVIFVNSVLGARTHRNAGVIELISNLVGKTPNAGLVTDAGRKAGWLVEVRTSAMPDPQVLGYAIGRKVLDGVPFVTGMERYLSRSLDGSTLQYLHDFGTNCAVGGGIGLYHIEGITPEATAAGRHLVEQENRHLLIDDRMIDDTLAAMQPGEGPGDIRPDRCLVGCPHLTLEQLNSWADLIGKALEKHQRHRLAVDTVFVAAPDVIGAFQESGDACGRLTGWGVRLSSFCLEALMQDRALAPRIVATNSNKLRHYNTGVFLFGDAELAEIMVTGEVSGWRKHEHRA